MAHEGIVESVEKVYVEKWAWSLSHGDHFTTVSMFFNGTQCRRRSLLAETLP